MTPYEGSQLERVDDARAQAMVDGTEDHFDHVDAVVRAMGAAWDRWTHHESFPFTGTPSRGYCVNATRTGVEALHVFGIAAKPASITMIVANRAADQLIRAGVPFDRWPEHAWSIGLGLDNDLGMDGGWNGHLVIDGGSFTLDLSAGMLERPGRISINGPLLLPPLPDDVDERQSWLVMNHVVVLLRAPANNAWRRMTGWTERRFEVERELVRRTREELNR